MLSTWGFPQVGLHNGLANPRLRLEFGESDSDDEYTTNEEQDEEELSTDQDSRAIVRYVYSIRVHPAGMV